ncbi:hypothetical protein [Streptomyces sp. NPDC087859]|uniref:hypothetical protein n=1 Tax=Streptomyces sp. NPDC087859 TaxID=3365812 RepID=UPI0037FF82C5
MSSWIPVLGSSRICSRSCSRAGKSISTSELIDLIWGDRAPSSALNILQKYVCAWRRLLDPPQWGIAYHGALLAEMWLAAGSHDRAEAALDRAVQAMRDYCLRYAEPPPNDSSQDRGPCLTAGPEGQSGPGMRSGADLISPAGIPPTCIQALREGMLDNNGIGARISVQCSSSGRLYADRDHHREHRIPKGIQP